MQITRTKLMWKNSDRESRVKAAVVITIDDVFMVHLLIVQGKSGLLVSMPQHKSKNGKYYDDAHPLNSKTRKYIEDAVFAAYSETQQE